MDNYELIYDYIEDAEAFGSSSILIIIAGIIGIFFALKHPGKKKLFSIIFLSIYILVALAFTVYNYHQHHKAYQRIETLYKKGKIKTVEGKVERFSSTKHKAGSYTNIFSVDGVIFSYGRGYIEGYHEVCEDGGAICKDDQEVKIEYYPYLPEVLQKEEFLDLDISVYHITKLYLKR